MMKSLNVEIGLLAFTFYTILVIKTYFIYNDKIYPENIYIK
jgi:hypothetical protein